MYINNKGYIFPTEDASLLAVLQSRVIWYAVSKLCTPLRLRAGLWQYQMFSQFTERLPIPNMPDAERNELAQLALRATTEAKRRYELHRRHARRIATDLLPVGIGSSRKLTEWWKSDFSTFHAEIERASGKAIPLRDRDDWQALLKERSAEHHKLTAQIIAAEEELNDRVYRLFGLGPDEIRLIEEETKYKYGEA